MPRKSKAASIFSRAPDPRVQAWTQEYLLQHWGNTPFFVVNSGNEEGEFPILFTVRRTLQDRLYSGSAKPVVLCPRYILSCVGGTCVEITT